MPAKAPLQPRHHLTYSYRLRSLWHVNETNERQIDGTLHTPMILFSKGGCKPDSDRMFYEGVPEFVIELWDPNAVTYYDFESTLEFYQRHGVAEVISNDEYRKLKDDKYEIVTPNENGIIVSDVLEGLHWDMASFRDHNWHKMMAAIDHGLSNAGR